MAECCKWCGSIDLRETIMSHGPHYSRLDCNDCGKFVKWGKKPANSAPAEPRDTNKYTGGFGMNNVSLVGRLTRDPELRYTAANNTAVCGYTLAVNRKYKQEGQPDADFVSIVAWQKTAEFCSKYFRKGQQVWVQGRIQTRTWEDDEGTKHYVTEVVAEQVGFADSKKDGEGSGQSSSSAPAQSQQSSRPTSSRPSSPPPQAGDKMPWEV